MTTKLEAALTIGIGGTGDTGQFLTLDADGNWWIKDTHNHTEIKLACPNCLRQVLNDRRERGDVS